jgi:hypothetical protein
MVIAPLIVEVTAIQTLANAAHDLTLYKVQALITGMDHEHTLVTPSTLLDGVQVSDLRLQTAQWAAVGVGWNLHARLPT